MPRPSNFHTVTARDSPPASRAHLERRHAGRGQRERRRASSCGADERQARQFALRDEAAVGPHQHPVPIVGEAPWRASSRALMRDAAAGLDRIDVKIR